MSAFKDLFDSLWEYLRNSPDPEMTPQRASLDAIELIDNYHDDLRRKIAVKQRQALKDYMAFRDGAVPWPQELEEWVINPIDPDKDPS